MKSIAFLDVVAPAPYGGDASIGQALGGTEATVLRVARRLSSLGYRVVVAQKARREAEKETSGVELVPYSVERGLDVTGEPFTHVVLLRAQKLMKKVASQNPVSTKWLWLHCYPGHHRKNMLRRAIEIGFSVLTVSRSLKDAVVAGTAGATAEDSAHVRVVYNPVDVSECDPPAQRDRDKLVFFSSPHKGIEQVFEVFARLRQEHPRLTLYVANPGYIVTARRESVDGLVDLGPLRHSEVLRHVAEAFCVLMAQSRFAETFGLVFAEANALGTPVIAHDIGAAAEVLTPQQIVDCDDPAKVSALFSRWRSEGPPAVSLKDEYTLDAVVARWVALLEEIKEESAVKL